LQPFFFFFEEEEEERGSKDLTYPPKSNKLLCEKKWKKQSQTNHPRTSKTFPSFSMSKVD
jgi:hypothetical protein